MIELSGEMFKNGGRHILAAGGYFLKRRILVGKPTQLVGAADGSGKNRVNIQYQGPAGGRMFQVHGEGNRLTVEGIDFELGRGGAAFGFEDNLDTVTLTDCGFSGGLTEPGQVIFLRKGSVVSLVVEGCRFKDGPGGLLVRSQRIGSVHVFDCEFQNLSGTPILLGFPYYGQRNDQGNYLVENNTIQDISLRTRGGGIVAIGKNAKICKNRVVRVKTSGDGWNASLIYTKLVNGEICFNELFEPLLAQPYFKGIKLHAYGIHAKGLIQGHVQENSVPGVGLNIHQNRIRASQPYAVGIGISADEIDIWDNDVVAPLCFQSWSPEGVTGHRIRIHPNNRLKGTYGMLKHRC